MSLGLNRLSLELKQCSYWKCTVSLDFVQLQEWGLIKTAQISALALSLPGRRIFITLGKCCSKCNSCLSVVPLFNECLLVLCRRTFAGHMLCWWSYLTYASGTDNVGVVTAQCRLTPQRKTAVISGIGHSTDITVKQITFLKSPWIDSAKYTNKLRRRSHNYDLFLFHSTESLNPQRW